METAKYLMVLSFSLPAKGIGVNLNKTESEFLFSMLNENFGVYLNKDLSSGDTRIVAVCFYIKRENICIVFSNTASFHYSSSKWSTSFVCLINPFV